MRYLLWFLKFALFMLVLSFAVKNTGQVTVRYYLGHEWQGPLVFVALAFFCAGIVIGVMAGVSHLIRQRREIVELKRELQARSRGGDGLVANLPAAE